MTHLLVIRSNLRVTSFSCTGNFGTLSSKYSRLYSFLVIHLKKHLELVSTMFQALL